MENEAAKLIMADEINCIEIELVRPFMVVPDDWIEISYYQDGRLGWGAGGDEYLTKSDIKEMAQGIREVLDGTSRSFAYQCGTTHGLRPEYRKPVLDILFSRYGDEFTFSAAMLDTLEREDYIKVEDSGISREKAEEYANIFYAWEKEFCDE